MATPIGDSKYRGVLIKELLCPDFLKCYFDSGSLQEFLGALMLYTVEDFESVRKIELDGSVYANTDFNSWEEMLEAAIEFRQLRTKT